MNETSAIVILFAAILTNNILLANFLGMCSFIACSGQIGTAVGLGTAVTFVMTMTAMINYAIYHFVLVPLGLSHFLTFIVFIAVIAAFVQFVEMFVEKFSPKLYFALGIFLPLITVNCAILGASLFMIIRNYNFLQSVGFGFGAGVGWALAIILMAGLRQKMRYSDVPQPFQGVPVAMIVTCVLAMAFMGFAGMVSIQ
jgi:Na+-transporting NADH:ubiquinone oxidoreductase subunit E